VVVAEMIAMGISGNEGLGERKKGVAFF